MTNPMPDQYAPGKAYPDPAATAYDTKPPPSPRESTQEYAIASDHSTC
jgi:hypothetical protein